MRLNRVAIAVIAVVVLVAGLAVGVAAGSLAKPQPSPVTAIVSPTPGSPTDAPESGAPTDGPSTGPTDDPGASGAPTATPEPTASPVPTPVLVPDPLTGVPVKPAVAKRRVIAVMIDDQFDARPQSGLSDASVVWQAPAEGGIPRYVALFHAGNPPHVGPIRSSRLYFIAWAAEWDSVYVHVGGSPQAIALLHSSKGQGKTVYDADYVRWGGGSLLYRVSYRFAPHNVYSDAKHLRELASKVGAPAMANPAPRWTFAPDAPLEQRPVGGRIEVPYPANLIVYQYDRRTNTYPRTVTGGKQFDIGPAKKVRIAPKNVVVMFVPFVPIGDKKHRLDGEVVGSGVAYISTNGRTIKGTWNKKSFNAPTRFLDANGNPVTFTQGQTFITVVPRGTRVTFKKGTPPPVAPSPSPTTTP